MGALTVDVAPVPGAEEDEKLNLLVPEGGVPRLGSSLDGLAAALQAERVSRERLLGGAGERRRRALDLLQRTVGRGAHGGGVEGRAWRRQQSEENGLFKAHLSFLGKRGQFQSVAKMES
jgi:hypothetical protein